MRLSTHAFKCSNAALDSRGLKELDIFRLSGGSPAAPLVDIGSYRKFQVEMERIRPAPGWDGGCSAALDWDIGSSAA